MTILVAEGGVSNKNDLITNDNNVSVDRVIANPIEYLAIFNQQID